MATTVIVWKLNEVMAQKRVRNCDLAAAVGLHENSVYRLRKEDKMPRLSHDTLNSLCSYLNVQPGDLLEWKPDNEKEK